MDRTEMDAETTTTDGDREAINPPPGPERESVVATTNENLKGVRDPDEQTAIELTPDDLLPPGEEQTQMQSSEKPRVSLEPLRRLTQELRETGVIKGETTSQEIKPLRPSAEQVEDETLLAGSEDDIPVYAARPKTESSSTKSLPTTVVQGGPEEWPTPQDENPTGDTKKSTGRLSTGLPETRISDVELPAVGERISSSEDIKQPTGEVGPTGPEVAKELNKARYEFTTILEKALGRLNELSRDPNSDEETRNRSRGQLAAALARYLEKSDYAPTLIEDHIRLDEAIPRVGVDPKDPPPFYSAEGKRLAGEIGLKMFENDPYRFTERFGHSHNTFVPRKRRIEAATKWIRKEKDPLQEVHRLMDRQVLLPDELCGVLYQLNGKQQKELLQAIENAEAGSPLLETREILERIDRSQKLREELTAAIQLELPHLNALDEMHGSNHESLCDKIVKMQPAGQGVNAPYFAMTKKGRWGVYKPRLQEAGNWRGDGTGGPHYRMSLRAGETVSAETVTPLVGLLIGMKYVLDTPMVNGPVGPGTMQLKAKGIMASRTDSWFFGRSIEPEYLESAEDIACLDALTHNSDRHAANLLVNTDIKALLPPDHGLSQVETDAPLAEIYRQIAERIGRYDLIDMSLEEMGAEDRKIIQRAYESPNYNGMCDTMSVPLEFFKESQTSPRLHERLSRLLTVLKKEDGQVRRVLLETYQLHFQAEKGQRLFDRLLADLERLVKTRKFPENGPMFMAIMGNRLEQRILDQLKKNETQEKKGVAVDPQAKTGDASPLPEQEAPKDVQSSEKKGPPPLPKRRWRLFGPKG
ncbi:MAG: hypothetical protein ABIJ46_00605 [bacterium]